MSRSGPNAHTMPNMHDACLAGRRSCGAAHVRWAEPLVSFRQGDHRELIRSLVGVADVTVHNRARHQSLAGDHDVNYCDAVMNALRAGVKVMSPCEGAVHSNATVDDDTFAMNLIVRQGFTNAHARLRCFPESEAWSDLDIFGALCASDGLVHPARRSLAQRAVHARELVTAVAGDMDNVRSSHDRKNAASEMAVPPPASRSIASDGGPKYCMT